MDLVSGPDVGGGYLFQLTVEHRGELDAFTVHAQEGGLDGADRATGSPALAGFSAATRACPIGGRYCWHRERLCPPATAMRVRFAYNRLRFVVGPLVAQRTGRTAVPFDATMREVVRRIVPSLASAGAPWVVGGSAAAALQGAAVTPGDIDLATTGPGVDLIAEALGEYLIDAVGTDPGEPAPNRRSARAFVGTFADGAVVEWGEFAPEGADGVLEGEWRASVAAMGRSVDWGGSSVPVVPIEFAIAKAALRRPDRLPALLAAARAGGIDRDRLERLLVAGGTGPRVRRAIVEGLGAPPDAGRTTG